LWLQSGSQVLSRKGLICLAKHLSSCGDARKTDVAGALIDPEIGWHGAFDQGEVDGGQSVGDAAGAKGAAARRAGGLHFGDQAELVLRHVSSIGRGYDKKRAFPKNFSKFLSKPECLKFPAGSPGCTPAGMIGEP
jgi:hypothetical protein